MSALGPPIHRTEVDGVPTFWSEAPGPPRAALVFRVGTADEQLAHRGLTHLIEHLAMPPHGRQHFECNATVEETRTIFWASGRDHEVSSFLSETSARLSTLPLDRLDAERGILRAEEESRGPSAFRILQIEYFGAQGYGLEAYPQFRIADASPDDLTTWAARHFTAGNAALWLTGAPPPGLHLDLPAGDRVPPPRPEPLPALPAVRYWGSGGGLTAGGLAQRSIATNATTWILGDRFRHRLRYELGVSYSLRFEYDCWTADDAFVHFWPDVREDREQEALEAMLADLDALVENGPTDEELEHTRSGMRRGVEDATYSSGLVDGMAFDELLGAQLLTRDDLLEQQDALAAGDVVEAARAVRQALLWVVPDVVEMPDDAATLVPPFSAGQVDGRCFRRRRSRSLRRRGSETMVIGGEGATLIFPREGAVTVRFEDCQAILVWEKGQRELIGRDGFRVWVESADEWSGGEELVALLDAGVAPDRRVLIPN